MHKNWLTKTNKSAKPQNNEPMMRNEKAIAMVAVQAEVYCVLEYFLDYLRF